MPFDVAFIGVGHEVTAVEFEAIPSTKNLQRTAYFNLSSYSKIGFLCRVKVSSQI